MERGMWETLKNIIIDDRMSGVKGTASVNSGLPEWPHLIKY